MQTGIFFYHIPAELQQPGEHHNKADKYMYIETEPPVKDMIDPLLGHQKISVWIKSKIGDTQPDEQPGRKQDAGGQQGNTPFLYYVLCVYQGPTQ